MFAETVEPAPDLVTAAEAVHAARRANSGLVARSTTRFEQVQALKAQGKGIKPIMRELGLAKETVRKFYRATSVEEVTATSCAGRPSVLDAFKPYLHERFTRRDHQRQRPVPRDPRAGIPRQPRHGSRLPRTV